MQRLTLAVAASLLGALMMGLAAAQQGVNTSLLMADAPAPTLSAYRLFVDPRGSAPQPGIVPYTLTTPLFSDYAEKQRFLYLPGGAAIGYRAEGVMDLPVGAVLIKTFSYPADLRAPGQGARKLETRLLIHRPASWVALTYVWAADGTDAVLKRAGARLPVSVIDLHGVRRDIDYVVPNVNQCKECHSVDATLSPIGPKARNFNGPLDYGAGSENQLSHLAAAGLLTGLPPLGQVRRTPTWNDPGQPVDQRARAYLDGNCGHCHNRRGFASNSGLYLDLEEQDMSAVGVGKRPVAAGRASGGLEFSIAPGDPDRSIIVHRMASTEPGVMMPPLGRSVVHEEGLALVRDYIARMPTRP